MKSRSSPPASVSHTPSKAFPLSPPYPFGLSQSFWSVCLRRRGGKDGFGRSRNGKRAPAPKFQPSHGQIIQRFDWNPNAAAPGHAGMYSFISPLNFPGFSSFQSTNTSLSSIPDQESTQDHSVASGSPGILGERQNLGMTSLLQLGNLGQHKSFGSG